MLQIIHFLCSNNIHFNGVLDLQIVCFYFLFIFLFVFILKVTSYVYYILKNAHFTHTTQKCTHIKAKMLFPIIYKQYIFLVDLILSK